MTAAVVGCRACRTPHHAECWSYLGRCSTYACRSIEADPLGPPPPPPEPIVEVDPLSLGLRLCREGKHGEAIPHLELAIAKGPDRLRALHALAAVHMIRHEPGKARPLLAEAASLDPRDGTYPFKLGICFWADFRHAEAIRDLEAAVALGHEGARVSLESVRRESEALAVHLVLPPEDAALQAELMAKMAEIQAGPGTEKEKRRRAMDYYDEVYLRRVRELL